MMQGMFVFLVWWVAIVDVHAQERPSAPPTGAVVYTLHQRQNADHRLHERFALWQLQLLEKLNRCDLRYLARLQTIVIPETWTSDELRYSPLPLWYPAAAQQAKMIVVHQPSQVFGGYEYGALVRWGPISSGAKNAPTPSGLFHLNWKSTGRHSTVNPDWFMPWYFNFDNWRGLSFHEYRLPGYPASHACIRLLRRDAQWLYRWGEEWRLDAKGSTILQHGTPVLILGQYHHGSSPPWRSLAWLATGVALPDTLVAESGG